MNKIIAIIAIFVVLVLALVSRPANTMKPASSTSVVHDAGYQQYADQFRNWVYSTFGIRVSGEVAKIKQPAQQEIVKQKDNFFQAVWEGIRNYLAGKFTKFSGTPVK
jgi:hypothetical protein